MLRADNRWVALKRRVKRSMTLLVTSAAGANGAGYGKVLAFADDGKPIGVFGDDPWLLHSAQPMPRLALWFL